MQSAQGKKGENQGAGRDGRGLSAMEANLRGTAGRLTGILAGTGVYAFGLHYFVIPNRLMEGGVTGVALLLNYALSLPPSLTTLMLNIPLFIIGWRVFGGPAMTYTVIGTLSVSLFLWLMEQAIRLGLLEPFRSEGDLLLAALYAGVTLGAGLGLVFRFGGTTGGSDILARLIHQFRGWSMGQIILAIDAVVLSASLFYISKERVLYTLVAVFIASKTIDFIQEGAYAAKAFFIISTEGGRIARRIAEELDRGVTLFEATGGYSGKPRHVVYCIVNRQESRKLRALVRRLDPGAFTVISDVHDVLGEGFRSDE